MVLQNGENMQRYAHNKIIPVKKFRENTLASFETINHKKQKHSSKQYYLTKQLLEKTQELFDAKEVTSFMY